MTMMMTFQADYYINKARRKAPGLTVCYSSAFLIHQVESPAVYLYLHSLQSILIIF
jgi:hypothetical protein